MSWVSRLLCGFSCALVLSLMWLLSSPQSIAGQTTKDLTKDKMLKSSTSKKRGEDAGWIKATPGKKKHRPHRPHYAFPRWWFKQALCVHRGEGAWNANTGNGFYGGMQFLHSTWVSNGGRRYAEYPHQATPKEQLIIAYRLWRSSGWYPWPNTARACGLI